MVGRRADGYHELDSLVVFAPPCDRLRFAGRRAADPRGHAARSPPRSPASPTISCCARPAGSPRRPGAPPQARITLDKRIPVAAGLGGGSADAAATLRGLNRLWRLGLSAADLLPLAAELGADVPVCLAARPTRMRGIGDRLEPVAGSARTLAAAAGQPAPAGRDRGGVRRPRGRCRPAAGPGPPPGARGLLLDWLRARANHLEAPARRLLPAIDDVLAALGRQPGCALARMSGSGATCFGLFADRDALARAAAALAAAHPDWWVAAHHGRPMIVLCTDFGLAGPYLGQVKAVLARAAPAVPVIDLFADLPAFEPRLAAYLLAAYAAWFEPGDVILAVVDPGVGGPRGALVVEADGRWFVGPDNGLFELVLRRAERARCYAIAWRPAALSATFHGRDLFAPVAARLALGEPPPGPRRAGPPSRLAGRSGRDRLRRPLRQRDDRPARRAARGRDRARGRRPADRPRAHLRRRRRAARRSGTRTPTAWPRSRSTAARPRRASG